FRRVLFRPHPPYVRPERRPPVTQHDENLIELVGPTNEGWYRTQIPDWIALHPDLKDGAFRLYVILRSLILEKQKTKIRVLSYDQLALRMVGKNGQPGAPPNERWYLPHIPARIALHPDLKDGAFRLYVILRSLILEKQKTKIRVLSYDQLAFLMVGKNGKPVSESPIKSLLRNLHDL